jgi:outer membrane protein assembly factor BamB
MSGFPFAITLWTAWLFVCKKWPAITPPAQRYGLWLLIVATYCSFDLMRWEGLDGGQHAVFAPRWSATAEQRFLAEHAQAKPEATETVALAPGDWPQFRGPNRDNQIHGLSLATDWNENPPQLAWKHRVGPGWSSMAIVGGRLFTQEQRGENEVVTCYDAATGEEIWAHEDATRFDEPLSGMGPRGTPTFADGRIYTLGATGKLNCLDAATGKPIWSHDVVVDADAAVTPAGFNPRQWGYSNSPLVANGLVFVFGGGQHDKGLLAYRAADGAKAWTSSAGSDGYSSPQLASIDGVEQLLIHSNGGLFAVEPDHGKLLWKLPSNSAHFLPVPQPQAVGDGRLLTQSENGTAMIQVSHQDASWSADQRWDSTALKTSLNDFVVHDGIIYGFDDGVFCAVDLATGKRRWKSGRYGHGQVLLLTDQPLLLVTSETGEVILLRPTHEKAEELGRFQAIEGKTWNHPAIAQNRLYVRNAAEMACYKLPVDPK